MRPINLIPVEDRRGERAPLRAGPLSYVLVGFLLLAFLGVYVMVTTGNTISERKATLAGLEQQLESTQARAEALQSFTDFATLEQTRTQTVSDLARSRFDWERIMRELALVIPGDVSLSSVTGSVSSEAGSDGGSTESPGVEGITSPTLTMSGCGSGHESVARFVAALRDIDGVTRVGLASSAESSAAGAASAAAPAAGSASGTDCVGAASFDVTVAFDGVQVDPSGAGIVPPEAASVAEDGSGVAEAEAQQEAAKDSAGSAADRGREAVKNYVPGA